MNDSFITVSEPARCEKIIKKSRFIAEVYPISSEEEAAEITARVKKEQYKATHVCSAWRLNSVPEKMKALDDGEPGGTAGKPMLEVILNREITNVLVLVIRYFGGIKLGAGGLVRAYAGACADVLDQAILIEKVLSRPIEIEVEYPVHPPLVHALEERGLKPVETVFEEMVKLRFEIDDGSEEDFLTLVRDLTSDAFLYDIGEARRIDKPLENRS